MSVGHAAGPPWLPRAPPAPTLPSPGAWLRVYRARLLAGVGCSGSALASALGLRRAPSAPSSRGNENPLSQPTLSLSPLFNYHAIDQNGSKHEVWAKTAVAEASSTIRPPSNLGRPVMAVSGLVFRVWDLGFGV